jgi:hypothetical protein
MAGPNDVIRALLTFVNDLDESWTQEQVYNLYLPLRQVKKNVKPDGTTEVLFGGLPPEEGIKPFLRDRLFLRAVLLAVIKKNIDELEKLREQLYATLRRTLDFEVTPTIDDKGISVDVIPVLTGVEACNSYALARLFEKGIDKLLRACPVVLDEDGDTGARCNKIFLYSRNGERKYCAEHSDLGVRQNLQKWLDDKRRREGRPPIRWGTKPWLKERKKEQGPSNVRNKRRKR